ncbi:MAG: 4-(cytidine 5'-diphospho)-2-C-methyl-D-erythritol kinase, partial [Bacteroides sp.]
MIVFPPAKINLGLNVTEKRPDGYHNLETIFYPIPLEDMLEVVVDTDLRTDYVLKQTGLAVQGEAEDNLIIKALRLLKKEFDIPPVRIYLHKLIPSGAGLGGGSAD